MTDISQRLDKIGSESHAKRLKKRYAAERRFRLYGLIAVGFGVMFLVFLVGTMIYKSMPAYTHHHVAVEVSLKDELTIQNADGSVDQSKLSQLNYKSIVGKAFNAYFPDVTERREKRTLKKLLGSDASFELEKLVRSAPEAFLREPQKVWVKLSDDADLYFKGIGDKSVKAADRRLSDKEIAWLDLVDGKDLVESEFNTNFFTNGDSREPEEAGIMGAIIGSFLTLLVTLLLSFPLGVMAAVYLEEFAPKNKWTDLIEVNINNLAAVPSIVFGLLGLAMFLNFFGLPRSAPLVGGMVLALLTLPTVIIATRASLNSVPPSIREAAMGVGASPLQVVAHHVLPLAMPGILTGSIIGMARALGESAPLLMIGMVAFIVDLPGGFTDPSTVLPVQIYIWVDSPEKSFVAKTSAATLVLLAFLVAMNGLAVYVRKKFERRW